MKKIVFLVLIFLIGCQKTPIYKVDRNAGTTISTINVGTTANDGTGDPLRTAFQKVNQNFSNVNTALGNIYTAPETRTLTNDSLNALRAAALTADDVYWQKTDTGYTYKQVISYNQLMDYTGAGSGVSIYKITAIVGTTTGTGSPTAGDSTIIHATLAGKEPVLWRGTTADLHRQYYNQTATNGKTGYRFSESTITVRPPWATGDRVLVEAINPANVTWLTFTGGTSALLTNLVAYWKADESAGTSFADAMGNQNGTTVGSVLVGQPGKLGYAQSFSGGTEAAMVPFNANIVPNGAFTFGIRIKLDVLPSVATRDYTIFGMPRGSVPYNPHHIQIRQSDNKIVFTTSNTVPTEYTVVSSSALVVGTWYDIVCVNPGNGFNLIMYVNGVDVSASAASFSGTVYTMASGEIAFGNSYDGGSAGVDGTIDDRFIARRAWSLANAVEWYNGGVGKTHPFN